MTAINTSTTVGDLVVEQPSRSRVFEKHGIDYCCGGGISLEQACRKDDIDLGTVVRELESATSETGDDKVDLTAITLEQLISLIISTHHEYLRRELPRLAGLTQKVANAHGDSPTGPQLAELVGVFRGLADELLAHMMKEERMLFPAIIRLETDGSTGMPFGSIANPIRVMEAEHDAAGNALERIRELTDTYSLPEWGCNTYRAMLDGLRELELDLHQHIHKENNILFPKAITLEASHHAPAE